MAAHRPATGTDARRSAGRRRRGGDAAGPDAGSVASVLNETAQTLLALHAAGLAHGSLGADTVVLAPNGAALLAAPALSECAPSEDVTAWAALARTLGDAWAVDGTTAAELFARCRDTAASDGLAAARRTLTGGRSVLPEGFLERAALRAAVDAYSQEPAAASEPAPVSEPASGTATDEQATVLGKRNRVPRTADPDPDPDTSEQAGEDGDILLRFGPGVPLDEQETLRALWPVAAPAPARRSRRRAWLGATAALAAFAVALWLLLRPGAGPAVIGAEVRAPTAELRCGQTADLVGVMTTDGRGGPVTYRWLRSDGQDSGELTETARRGERTVTVHLRWTVRGSGLFRGSARLQVRPSGTAGGAPAPIEARGTFGYSCP